MVTRPQALWTFIKPSGNHGAVGSDRYAFLTDLSLPVTRFSPDEHDGAGILWDPVLLVVLGGANCNGATR
jgi:hypothetical protein